MSIRNPSNELHTEFLGIHSLNAFSQYNSSSRAVMFASHFGQRLVIEGANSKRIQTGAEQEFGRYTFNVKMPEDGKIIKVIEKYPAGIDKDSLLHNPETIVVYENDKTKQIDYFSIPYYASHHQFFGYKYDIKPAVAKIKTGAYIAKDTVFADSPCIGANGDYMYGISANVAYMSIPSVSEDGIMVSRDFLPKLKFRVYETRVVEFGSSKFPLNLYGNKDEYKAFPDIGEYIRDDGILMMLRQYEDDLSPVEMSVLDTMEPDFTFDKAVYVRGGVGKIVDVRLISNNNNVKNLPRSMCKQLDKYEKASQKFYREIIDLESQLRYDRKKKYGEAKLNISPKLHRLIVESLAVTNHDSAKFKQNLNLIHRKAPVDEYRIEFVIEYIIEPKEGFKLTDSHGGKGVIVKIEEPENMPIDRDGNRADIVMDAASVISRMNIGKLYEHYFSGSARDVSNRLRKMSGFTGKVNSDIVATMDDNKFNELYSYLLGYYQIVSDRQYEFYMNISKDDKYEHLASVLNDGIYVYFPIENQKDIIEIIKEIEAKYTPTFGPVTYVGNSGRKVVTKEDIRVAPLYMMLLEKIADDWSSVSTGNLQHFGILSQITKAEKFAMPYRNSPVRTIGETEGRIFTGYCGREAIAEMMDKSNNPATQRNMVWNVLDSANPTNIQEVVDRNFITLGGTKPKQILGHMFGCHGFKMVYEPEGN